jgi:hypothetical protein
MCNLPSLENKDFFKFHYDKDAPFLKFVCHFLFVQIMSTLANEAKIY